MEVTMRNLKTIEKKVRAVLEKNEDARNDDMVLYLALCRDDDAAQISRSAEL